MIILQDSGRMNGHFSKIWLNKWLSCKTLVKTNGYLARFLQNEQLSRKILVERLFILHDSGWMYAYLEGLCQDE